MTRLDLHFLMLSCLFNDTSLSAMTHMLTFSPLRVSYHEKMRGLQSRKELMARIGVSLKCKLETKADDQGEKPLRAWMRSLYGVPIWPRITSRYNEIPWDWIEDRLRKPHSSDGSYDDLADFAKYIQYYYSRDFWQTQSSQLKVWVEKDALSGVFNDALARYRVTYNVGRGFDGWSSIYNASERYGDGENVTVLYFGDFDPSGEEMVTSLRKRLADLGSNPEIIKVSLTKDEVLRYNLPHDFTKETDTRSKKFIEKYGDMAVELDALPATVLQARIVEEVEKYVDLDALAAIKEVEKQERVQLVEALRSISGQV